MGDEIVRALPPVRKRVRITAPPYEVGYKKPPKHSQFKPGQTGNSNGRPRGSKGFATILHEILSEKITVRTAGGERKVRRMEALLLKQVEAAGKGNMRAMEKLVHWYLSLVAQPAAPLPSSYDRLPTETDHAMLHELIAMLA